MENIEKIFSLTAFGELGSLKELIDSDSNLINREIKDSFGNSLLIEAAKNGHLNIVNYLMNKNVEVDYFNCNGNTALHYAAGGGFENIIKVLIQHNANLDLKDKNGKTALHWAFKNNQTNCLRILIDKGADINAKDNNNEPALNWLTKFKPKTKVKKEKEIIDKINQRIEIKDDERLIEEKMDLLNLGETESDFTDVEMDPNENAFNDFIEQSSSLSSD